MAVTTQIDWKAVRGRTKGSPYAAAFFTLAVLVWNKGVENYSSTGS